MNRLVFLVLVAVMACEVKPQEIAYGEDACHFCMMTIVDRQHAAQIVTVKGKAYKYDAIECMMNHLNKWDKPEIKYHLVTDYTTPGKLIDAKEAHYLISEAIPSPMGEFLTGFYNQDDQRKVISESGGTGLTWVELKKEFSLPE